MAEEQPGEGLPGRPGDGPEQGPVIFFDGVCNLCNGMVDFLVRRDKARRPRYAPLQGETAARVLLGPQPMPGGDPDTIVLLRDGELHYRSGAVLRIVAGLGGLWRLAQVLRAVPVPIRDVVYNFVARNRYRWFGRRDMCRLPTADERDLFLP